MPTPSLEVIQQFKMTGLVGTRPRYFGDKTQPVLPTVAGAVFDETFTLADNFGNQTLWSSGVSNGNFTAFQYMLVLCDADIVLEIANTVPANDERALIFVKANTIMVIPGQSFGAYASATSRLDGAALVLATDYNNINEIRAQRNVAAGGGAANVRLALIN